MGIEPIKKTAFDTKPKSLLYARARVREDPLTLGFVQHDFIRNAKSVWWVMVSFWALRIKSLTFKILNVGGNKPRRNEL